MTAASTIVYCFGLFLLFVLTPETSGQFNSYGTPYSNYLSGYNQLSSENQARLYQAQLQQQNWLFQQQLNQQQNQQAYLQQQAAALLAEQTGQYRYPPIGTAVLYTSNSGVLPANFVASNLVSSGNVGTGSSGLYGNTGLVDV